MKTFSSENVAVQLLGRTKAVQILSLRLFYQKNTQQHKECGAMRGEKRLDKFTWKFYI